jgi:hypothetical protein
MGLLGALLLPITGPVWGVRLFAERLHDEANAVLYDEGRGFAELLELSMMRNAGKLSDAEYAEAESALLERLSALRDQEDDSADDGGDFDDADPLDGEPDDGDLEC